MKQLRFERHCTERDGEFKQMMRMLFWEELERQQMEDARGLLQEQIYREFDVQIGAPRYGRSESRRDERNGHRIRSYEILGGRVGELRIPRAREMEIRFTVLEKWERVQPKVVAALLTAYLLGKSAAAGSMIAEAFGQSRFSRTYLQRLVRQFERRLKQWRERLIKRSWPYIFIDGMVVKVYEAEHLKEKVVIFAYGMDDEHRTELLGWVVADSEEEGAVRSLLIDLRRRGLQTPELFISDAQGDQIRSQAGVSPRVLAVVQLPQDTGHPRRTSAAEAPQGDHARGGGHLPAGKLTRRCVEACGLQAAGCAGTGGCASVRPRLRAYALPLRLPQHHVGVIEDQQPNGAVDRKSFALGS